MRRRRETGVGAMWIRDAQYLFDPADFDRVANEWMNGTAPFIETRNYHGDRLIVKRGLIDTMQLFTAEGIAAQRQEDAADKSDDAITGAD